MLLKIIFFFQNGDGVYAGVGANVVKLNKLTGKEEKIYDAGTCKYIHVVTIQMIDKADFL